ncbi:MAG: hypothetical protein AAGD22_00920 [Verrucomicrobiota bacterium]
MWETIASILGKKSFDAALAAASRGKTTKGQVADFLDELKTNALRCELVLAHDADPREEGRKLSRTTYRHLRAAGFKFEKIKKGAIPVYESTKGTDVAFLSGKTLDEALANASERIRELETICHSSASLKKIDLQRRFANLAKRLAVIIRFISSRRN